MKKSTKTRRNSLIAAVAAMSLVATPALANTNTPEDGVAGDEVAVVSTAESPADTAPEDTENADETNDAGESAAEGDTEKENDGDNDAVASTAEGTGDNEAVNEDEEANDGAAATVEGESTEDAENTEGDEAATGEDADESAAEVPAEGENTGGEDAAATPSTPEVSDGEDADASTSVFKMTEVDEEVFYGIVSASDVPRSYSYSVNGGEDVFGIIPAGRTDVTPGLAWAGSVKAGDEVKFTLYSEVLVAPYDNKAETQVATVTGTVDEHFPDILQVAVSPNGEASFTGRTYKDRTYKVEALGVNGDVIGTLDKMVPNEENVVKFDINKIDWAKDEDGMQKGTLDLRFTNVDSGASKTFKYFTKRAFDEANGVTPEATPEKSALTMDDVKKWDNCKAMNDAGYGNVPASSPIAKLMDANGKPRFGEGDVLCKADGVKVPTLSAAPVQDSTPEKTAMTPDATVVSGNTADGYSGYNAGGSTLAQTGSQAGLFGALATLLGVLGIGGVVIRRKKANDAS